MDEVLGRLNEREKVVFRLYLDGLTTRDIGTRLGISHVMVVKIKKKIKEKCYDLKGELGSCES
jgi:RNA polymerase sigma factor (sigma-70 family)